MLTFRCAWAGCEANYSYPSALPPGWVCLVTFRSTEVPGILSFGVDKVFRDAVLCPEHVAALERCLFPL